MASQAPVTVSIVGTGSTSGGGDAPTPSGTIATTPGTQADLLVNVVPPVIAISVRFAKAFLVSFVGLVTAAGLGAELLSATDMAGIMKASAWLSLSIAGVDFGKNLITVFGRLEGKYPLSTGSI